MNLYNQLPALIRASLNGDKRTVELAANSILRKLKKENPKIGEEIADIIANYNAGAPVTRSMGVNAPPLDKDSFNSLVNITDYTLFDKEIILDSEVENKVQRFLKERELANKLIVNGIKPPNSLILSGSPGVGKTLLSNYIAAKLCLPLVTIDLSASISSYLGKTGQNLKKVLDYGKENPAVLFLDEFDAIAKRRDDPTDLGELKRIVNVLLKELEEWPNHSVIIGATNHPEFLDRAIWRRFDLKIEIPLPNENQRFELWSSKFNNDFSKVSESFLQAISVAIEEISPSDINQIGEKVLRQIIVDNVNPIKTIIQELKEFYKGDRAGFNKHMILALKDSDKTLSQAKIAKILGISPSTVNHHLSSIKGK